MVLTVSFELSPVTGLFCHRRPRTNVLSKPGWADSTSANLTPASGRQDHTTSPYAAASLVRSLDDRSQAFRQPALQSRRAQNAAASTASAPRVRDDRDTPLWWGGMRKVLDVIWGNGNQNIFRKIRNKTRQDGQINEPSRRINARPKPGKSYALKAAVQDLTNADTVVEIIKTPVEIFEVDLARQQPIHG
jgi:hypothetical protein